MAIAVLILLEGCKYQGKNLRLEFANDPSKVYVSTSLSLQISILGDIISHGVISGKCTCSVCSICDAYNSGVV